MPDDALPDLKTRIVLDDNSASVLLNAFIAKVNEVDTKVKTAGGSDTQAFKHVKEGLTGVEVKARETISLLGRITSGAGIGSVIGGAKGGLFGALSGLSTSIPVVGGLAMGLTSLIDKLDDASRATADYGTEILRNSKLIGMNTTDFQVLSQAAGKFGMDQGALTTGLIRFQRNLETGGGALGKLGLSLEKIGITSKDTSSALSQLAKYMEGATNIAERNAVGLTLLGKSGKALIEVLSQGPEFMRKYRAELEHWGIIMDDNQLKTAAFTKTINDQFHMALQGLQTQVGTNLQAAFNVLYLSVMKIFGDNPAEQFRNIGRAIGGVLSWCVGLIQGLFGVNLQLKDLAGIADSPSGKLNELADAFKTVAPSMEDVGKKVVVASTYMADLTRSTNASISAIDAQINALDDQTKALDNQWTMAKLLQTQQDEQHTSFLSHLQDELDAVRGVSSGRRSASESLIDYQRRLEEQALTKSIDVEGNRRKAEDTSHSITMLLFKEATDAQKAGLEARKQAMQDYLSSVKNAAMESAAVQQQLFDDTTTAANKEAVSIDELTKGMYANITSGSTLAGKSFGQGIAEMIGHIQEFLGKLGEIISMFGNIGGAAKSVWDFVTTSTSFIHAQASGDAERLKNEAIMRITQATSISQINQIAQMAAQTNVLNNDQMNAIQNAARAFGMAINRKDMGLPGFTIGGFTYAGTAAGQTQGGPHATGGRPQVGATSLIGEHGAELWQPDVPGEIIPLNPRDRTAGGYGGGGHTFVTNYYGPVADEYVAKRVTDRHVSEARRRGLLHLNGVGG